MPRTSRCHLLNSFARSRATFESLYGVILSELASPFASGGGAEAQNLRQWNESLRSAQGDRALHTTGIRFAALALGAGLLAGCAGVPSTVSPAGTGADEIAKLWWWSFAIGIVVLGVVVALLLFKILLPDESRPDLKPGQPGSSTVIVLAGVVVPAVILLALFVPSLLTFNGLVSAHGADDVVIDVTGYQWWWEVRYPNQQFTTANEIHIPVGRPIQINLRSFDVIHNFWVPQLNGKIAVFPDHPTSVVLQATQAGIYRGECAEYCGIDHANMNFIVFADPPAQFDTWLKGQEQTAATPGDAQTQRGLQVFFNGKCAGCHTIRGTPAQGKLGPDLTHFASRTTIAGNTFPNTRGFLSGWVVDAPGMKPQVKMPPNAMTGPDLQALLAYLESLH